MNIRVYTGRSEQILKIGVNVLGNKPQTIRLIVSDADQNNTVFTNRFCVFVGKKNFYVRMPLSPKVALVQIYNEAKGNRPANEEDTFSLIGQGIEKMPLEKKTDVADLKNADVRSFVTFAERFSYNAGVMGTGPYRSDDSRFVIHYCPAIYNSNGTKSSTPARIGEETKVIEVSQEIFIPFTVPMRLAILFHEFAHCFRNTDKFSEKEADLQGLLIYLGLGYPRIEACEAFLDTFIGSPTPQNQDRYDTVKRFINDFETYQFMLYD